MRHEWESGLPNHEFRTEELTASGEVLSGAVALGRATSQDDRLRILSNLTKLLRACLSERYFHFFGSSSRRRRDARGHWLSKGT